MDGESESNLNPWGRRMWNSYFGGSGQLGPGKIVLRETEREKRQRGLNAAIKFFESPGWTMPAIRHILKFPLGVSRK
jgi:hypothetical protein